MLLSTKIFVMTESQATIWAVDAEAGPVHSNDAANSGGFTPPNPRS